MWSDNYKKCFRLFFEAGAKTLIQTLRWAYTGPTDIEVHLVDLVLKWPSRFHSIEVKALESLNEGKIAIEELSLSLLLKVSLQLCSTDLEKELPIWTQFCQSENRAELGNLLENLKDRHKSFSNSSKNSEDVSDSFVVNKCEEMKDLLTSILQMSGLNICGEERNDAIANIRSTVDLVRSNEKWNFSNPNNSKFIVLQDLNDLSMQLRKELQGYCIPDLTLHDNRKSTVHLEDILVDDNTRTIVVLGEAGMGKTLLTKFLFNSWSCDGLASPIKKLSNFDFVFRMDCRKIRDKEMTQYFQDCLPFTSLNLPNTSKLMKFLKDLKILWIMDGYDECTAEFKSFFTTLTKQMPDDHRLIITSRPNKHEALKKSLNGVSQSTLIISLLNESKMEEIIKQVIFEENKLKSFKEELNSLSEAGKSCLSVPLNLSMYIELWSNVSVPVKESFTAMTLYRKYTDLHLQKLIDKESHLIGAQSQTNEAEQWFYGSLCKQCFLSVMRWDNILNDKALETLNDDACKASIVSKDFLSAFLSETTGRNGRKNYDFKYREQQYLLASLFLKKLKNYKNNPMKELLNNAQIYPALELLKFYIEMTVDDDSINTNTAEMFYPILQLSLAFKLREQKYIWCSTSVAAKFNMHFMEEMAKSTAVLTQLDTSIFETHLEVAEFLKYVHPRKIRIVNSNTFESNEKSEFLSLLEVLKEQQLEIHLHTNFSELDDVKGTSEIDLVNEMPLRITSFTGTMMEFPFLVNHFSSLETLELMIYSEEEFLHLCEILFECDSLKDIQLYIVFDSFSSSVPLSQFPEELLVFTTLSCRRLTEDNFDNFIFLVSELKGSEALKFKALYHCLDPISEIQKQSLDEVATLVAFDRCPYSKSLSKEAEFQMYSFPVEFHEVHSWKYCYQTYRNR